MKKILIIALLTCLIPSTASAWRKTITIRSDDPPTHVAEKVDEKWKFYHVEKASPLSDHRWKLQLREKMPPSRDRQEIKRLEKKYER